MFVGWQMREQRYHRSHVMLHICVGLTVEGAFVCYLNKNGDLTYNFFQNVLTPKFQSIIRDERENPLIWTQIAPEESVHIKQ